MEELALWNFIGLASAFVYGTLFDMEELALWIFIGLVSAFVYGTLFDFFGG